jgi:hypothetical protein
MSNFESLEKELANGATIAARLIALAESRLRSADCVRAAGDGLAELAQALADLSCRFDTAAARRGIGPAVAA